MFGALHVRSHYSFLAGASSPDELAAEAVRCGHDALAITDRHGVYGAVEHQRACRRHGLRPIVGAEVLLDGSPIVLLARGLAGYGALCSLLTTAQMRGREQPTLVMDDLEGSSLDDLLVLTGGRESKAWHLARTRSMTDLATWLRTLHARAPGRVFAELVHHCQPGDTATAERLYAVATENDILPIIGSDVRHATADAYAVYDAMTCIREHRTIFDHHPARPVNDEQRLHDERTLRRRLPYDEAFRTTASVLERCTIDLMPDVITPPAAELDEGRTAQEMIEQRTDVAFERRYGGTEIETRARRQLEHERRVIASLELDDFFLVVQEVVNEARRRRIRCSGRGSAANSIVAYLLGITGVCPIRHNLLFERFLHGGRKGTPDIDIDFDSDRRAEMIAWIERRFGMEHTAMTAVIATYRQRMAVRDSARALGWPSEQVTALSKSIPGYHRGPMDEHRAALVAASNEAPLLDILIRVASMLEGRPRHLGQHSGGMILSRRPLWQSTPVQISANGVKVAQFAKDDIEALGLIKLDVLGLRMLATISETMELIGAQGLDVPDIDEISLDDPAVYAMIREGKTLGVFQIESQGQMHLLAQHQPEVFNDIVTEIALFRPGPLQGGMVNPYIRRRRGQEPVTYLHPDLEDMLGDTLGVIIYQEQILDIAHRFAGMPLDQADDFRDVISKDRDPHAIETMRSRFVEGAVGRGIGRSIAEAVCDQLSHFVGYGFCRSHAAAFAKTVYQSAWLKLHHPAAFMAAFMQHRPGMYNLMTLEEEARRCGVEVLGPCVHRSGIRYGTEVRPDGRYAIRKPLTSVRGCTDDDARAIMLARSRRPLSSVDDCYRRTAVAVDTLEALALAGAMDSLTTSSRRALWELGVLRRRLDRDGRLAQEYAGMQTLFDLPLITEDDVPILPPMTATERLAYDYRTHGAARFHPMTLYRRQLSALEVRSIETCYRLSAPPEQDATTDGHRRPAHRRATDTGMDVTVAGIVILRQRPPTAKGVLFLTIEDETGFIQCVVRPEQREMFSTELRHAALMIKGRLHAEARWRGLVVRDVHVVHHVIGGYHGHPAMYGGTDTMELQIDGGSPGLVAMADEGPR